jgi:glycosyltransferase involved in cell wall biosynthesis
MFSVVIPLYNKEKCIVKTIQSVLNQTCEDFEIVIVNDGSTDMSVREAEKISDIRIRIVNQKNTGVSAARNRGVAEAKFKYIAFLDADDVWMPDHLQEISDLKNHFPECVVFSTNYKIVDTKQKSYFPVDVDKVLPLDSEIGIVERYFHIASNTAPPLFSSAICIEKNALHEIEGFPVNVVAGEDLLTWAKLACRYKIAFSKKITVIYNFYAPDEWMMFARKQDEDDIVGSALEGLLADCASDCKDLEEYIVFWYRMRLYNFMKIGDRPNAGVELQKIFKYSGIDYKACILYFMTLIPEYIKRFILSKRARYLDNKCREKF